MCAIVAFVLVLLMIIGSAVGMGISPWIPLGLILLAIIGFLIYDNTIGVGTGRSKRRE